MESINPTAFRSNTLNNGKKTMFNDMMTRVCLFWPSEKPANAVGWI
jgi:hypothetical protein